MFVIALDAASASGPTIAWGGRRHDDAESNATAGTTSDELFEAVFQALHDGEQVAVGVDAELVADAPGGSADEDALLEQARATATEPGRAAMIRLLDQLGQWRPWTAVSTSIPGWRATRSVLVYQFDGGRPDAAVEALFDLVTTGRGDAAPAEPATVVNLVAAAAIGAGLTVDRAELTRPVLRVEPAAG